MSAQYPSDPRNIRAARCLAALAGVASELSEQDWSSLKPHSSWASETFREAISKTARMVGFQKHIIDLRTFVETLVTVLQS
jgi:hypothetical protein